jgi:peptide/nickel transport system permease protein
MCTTLVVLFGVGSVTFFLLRLTPGDPAEIMLKDHGSAADAQAIRIDLGLDKTFGEQYLIYLKKTLHGDLGTDFFSHRKVSEEILQHLPPTLILAFSAIFVALIFGVPLGVFAAYKRSKFIDRFFSAFTLFGLSVPSFWLGPVLIIIFSIKLNILPVSGRDDGVLSLILPTISIGFSLGAVLARISRASVLEVLNEDYINVARAKGLTENFVVFKHALKNALGPILTVIGLQIGAIATGVVITETIFDWPGVGILLYSALRSRNYPVVQGCVLLIACLYVCINFLTDIGYFVANPQLREK